MCAGLGWLWSSPQPDHSMKAAKVVRAVGDEVVERNT